MLFRTSWARERYIRKADRSAITRLRYTRRADEAFVAFIAAGNQQYPGHDPKFSALK
jgi:hypothetical protein